MTKGTRVRPTKPCYPKAETYGPSRLVHQCKAGTCMLQMAGRTEAIASLPQVMRASQGVRTMSVPCPIARPRMCVVVQWHGSRGNGKGKPERHSCMQMQMQMQCQSGPPGPGLAWPVGNCGRLQRRLRAVGGPSGIVGPGGTATRRWTWSHGGLEGFKQKAEGGGFIHGHDGTLLAGRSCYDCSRTIV